MSSETPLPAHANDRTTTSLKVIHSHTYTLLDSPSPPAPLPSPSTLTSSTSSLLSHLPTTGYGLPATTTHLLNTISPGLNHSALSPSYYGFVTGGVTPAALCADALVSTHDANVQVHLPHETIATAVEDRALSMLVALFGLDEKAWRGRTFTTGATAANVAGLACGREWVLRERGRRMGLQGKREISVGQMGLLEACAEAGVKRVKVLSTRAHSSLGKAASVVGLGRGRLVDVGVQDGVGLGFDWEVLERELRVEGTVCVVAVSCAEVNTGAFATGVEEMRRLSALCHRYGAWLHVDAAFGIFARCLPDTPEFASVRAGALGLELVDSIAGDGHKMLNVPYDCGFFFTRHLEIQPAVFQNANAVYLGGAAADVPSPLNIGLENSRKFRALPVYATLMAYGREGYEDMVVRQVRLARKVAAWIDRREGLELLPEVRRGKGVDDLFIVVLFRAADYELNEELVRRINNGREMYVSATKWDGKPASRIAVSNWQVDVERDFKLVTGVLDGIVAAAK